MIKRADTRTLSAEISLDLRKFQLAAVHILLTSTNRARVPQVLPSTSEMPELKIWDKIWDNDAYVMCNDAYVMCSDVQANDQAQADKTRYGVPAELKTFGQIVYKLEE